METIEHKKEVKKLNALELELINLISQTENANLMTKFMEWQTQRGICNQGFCEYIDNQLNN